MRIVVRMPNWLGDLVMATPVLADLRAAYPDAHITAWVRGPAGVLLDGVDAVVDRPDGRYDIGLLLTNSLSSAWALFRTGTRRRIGFRNEGRSLLLTDPLPFPVERGREHLVITYKRLLAPLGIALSETAPHIRVETGGVLEKFSLKKPLVGINPGAAYGSAKCWLPERFREVVHFLLEKTDRDIVFFGDSKGAPLVDAICAGMPARVHNLAGQTSLSELATLLASLDAFLTGDSGPMHVAAALGTPLVALFGSTNDTATGPYRHGHVIHKHVSCSPCYKRTCPIDFKCMKKIETQEVAKKLYEKLTSNV